MPTLLPHPIDPSVIDDEGELILDEWSPSMERAAYTLGRQHAELAAIRAFCLTSSYQSITSTSLSYIVNVEQKVIIIILSAAVVLETTRTRSVFGAPLLTLRSTFKNLYRAGFS
jgi:hypothetical protein